MVRNSLIMCAPTLPTIIHNTDSICDFPESSSTFLRDSNGRLGSHTKPPIYVFNRFWADTYQLAPLPKLVSFMVTHLTHSSATDQIWSLKVKLVGGKRKWALHFAKQLVSAQLELSVAASYITGSCGFFGFISGNSVAIVNHRSYSDSVHILFTPITSGVWLCSNIDLCRFLELLMLSNNNEIPSKIQIRSDICRVVLFHCFLFRIHLHFKNVKVSYHPVCF